MHKAHHAVHMEARPDCCRRIRVLLYHRILRGGNPPGETPGFISEEQFHEQLALLERFGYTSITFQDYALICEGELSPPRRPIILTFDDGYKDTYDVAVPVLKEFGMKAVIFALGDAKVVTNSWDIGNGKPAVPLMSERDLIDLYHMGNEIGSHSLTHPRLTDLPKEAAWEEIVRSRMRLEITLNARVQSFAYPFGLLNPTIKRLVAEAGFRFACSVWSGPFTFGMDPFEIRRIEVSRCASISSFAAKVIGPYPAYYWFRSKVKGMLPGRKLISHSSQARTLLLISAGLGWPERATLASREAADQCPRLGPLLDALNSDVLNENFLRQTSRRQVLLHRPAGVGVAQVLEAFAARHQYDVIVSWAENLGLPLAGLLALVGSKTPHVAIFSWISKPKKALVLKLVHRGISRIILMSSAQRDFAIHSLWIPPEKIRLLRWPVDLKFWRPMETAEDGICSVGREMRDYGTLIESLRSTSIPCHIAAGGQSQVAKGDSWLEHLSDGRRLPPNVTTGWMNYAELRNLYARSRFVVIPILPTDTDNGTTSILEAMGMGKAVICTRVAGQRDVLLEGKTGLFVPPGDPRALREAIERLWNRPELAREMGKQARAYVERYHSLESWIEDVRAVIEEVLVERGRFKQDKFRHEPLITSDAGNDQHPLFAAHRT